MSGTTPTGANRPALAPARRAIVPIALVLALATGVLLAETRLVVLAPVLPAADSPRENANTATVQRFYTAVNALLRDGDVGSLDPWVADDFALHTSGSRIALHRDDLIDGLRSLRAVAPDARITVLDLVAQEDRVVARVRLDAADAVFLGLPLTPNLLWGAVDVFRIRSGEIVESWSDRETGALFTPLLSAAVPIAPPLRKVTRLDRWTFAAGGAVHDRLNSGLLAILVESGSLSVVLDPDSRASASVVPAGDRDRPPATRSVGPGEGTTLAVAEALILPQGSRYTITSRETAAALVLSLAAASPTGGASISSGGDATPSPRFRASVSGIAYAYLAGGTAIDLPAGSVVVSIGRAVLASAAELPPHETGVAEFVAVESGSLGVTVGDGNAWIAPDPANGVRTTASATLTPGSGAMIPSGASASYRADGRVEAVGFLLVRIRSRAEVGTEASPIAMR